MVDTVLWKPTAPFHFGTERPVTDPVDPATHPRAVRHQAITLLLQRGYVYVGEDSVGLPCFRSRSGAMLIGVGSCRCLAYAKVDGRLQVVAAARTLALLCRIGPDTDPAGAVSAGRGDIPAASHAIPQPEPVLFI